MKHANKRVGKIVDELFTFFLNIGAKNITINYQDQDLYHAINLDCDRPKGKEKELAKLKKYLKCEKSEEMEEFFWELAGESDVDTEITIVGMMCDEKKLSITDDRIEIKLKRYK